MSKSVYYPYKIYISHRDANKETQKETIETQQESDWQTVRDMVRTLQDSRARVEKDEGVGNKDL